MLPGTIAPDSYMPSRVKKELDWPVPIARGQSGMKVKRVQEWLSLHGFAVLIDGDFGPATEQRVKDFQASKGIVATGRVENRTHGALVQPLVTAIAPIDPTGKTLSRLILAYSLQHVAQHPREAGGDNRGPWVRAYLNHDGPDWKWCSGFVCFALEHAARTLGVSAPIASSPSCDTMKANASAQDLYHREGAVPVSKILPGSFFLVRRTSTDWTHIGIVSKAEADFIRTVEGNTNNEGSVNGYEACERARNYAKKDFIIW
ncbi:MAG: peptidoglycan-binding domain-containing protein [Aestuariivirga sp.]